MKTNSLLTLVSLAVLATYASAAPQPQPAVFVLPPYVVSAPLCQPAEQRVNASLNELRLQSRIPTCIPIDLPLLRNPQLRPSLPKLALRDPRAIAAAKF